LEPGTVIDIGLDETALLIRGGISSHIARPGHCSIMVVVCPFVEVIGKLETTSIRARIFKVNDDELLVFVSSLKQG
jgi:hypothetical protein